MADNTDPQRPHQKRLPSVENIDSSGQAWQVGASQPEHHTDFRGHFPKPQTRSVEFADVPSRSTESKEGRLSHGFENPAFDNDDSFIEDRKARYHGKYSSYDDMLGNMDDRDPFTGDPPEPSEDVVRRTREARREARHRDRALKQRKSRSSSIPQPMDGGTAEPRQRPKKKRSRSREHVDAKSRKEIAKEPDEELGNTFTVMQDNPNYEAFQPPQQRRVSRESTGTYTARREDSKRQLLPHEVRPSSVEPDVKTSPSRDELRSKVQRAESTADSIKGPHYGELDQEAIAQYVTANVEMRQCDRYIKNKDSKDESEELTGDCYCGRDFAWHEDMGISYSKSQEEWKAGRHTKTVPSTCYGTICFQGFGQDASRNAPYVRIDQDTDPEVIWTLVEKHWKMPKPKLIISVTGGAKRFFLKSRLRNNFKRGLVNVATTTGAWIITGGTNAGVMEFVGEAVRDYQLTAGTSDQKVIALGIATWGIVDNLESLTPEDATKRGLFPASYHCNDLCAKTTRGKSPLDFNHTHFILVDNGQEKKFGAEIKFRAAFENKIAHMKTEVARNQTVTVPVVMLVLEGGENTIKTAKEALENNTPVVIIQGSGRAAEVIAFAYKYFKSKTDDQLVFTPDDVNKQPKNPKAYDEIRDKVEDWLDWSREKEKPELKKKKIYECVRNIEKMLQKRNLLTVFFLDDMDTTNEIDQAILYALLKAKKSQFLQQLNLALAWNRCDIAREEIFKNENRHEWQHQMPALCDAMFTALVQNRIDFVQLFLDNGVEMKDFLNVRRLRELYDEVVNDSRAGNCAHLLRHLLQREQSNWNCCCRKEEWEDNLPHLLMLVGQLVNDLVGDQFQNMYKAEKYLVYDEVDSGNSQQQSSKDEYGLQTMSYSSKPPFEGNSTARSIHKRKSKALKPKPDFEIPERDLLLWAVLLNRKEMALLFWKMGKDHIGGALTASSLLKALAAEAGREEELDLSNELMSNSEEFEELSVGVLNECYQRDKGVAHQLLVRSLDTWGGTTVLSVADSAEQMSLMGHSSCQTKLNRIWKGKMALYTSMWKILLGLVFFPFIIPTIRFTKADFGDMGNLGLPKREPVPPNQIQPAEDQLARQRLGTTRKKVVMKLYSVDWCGCCTSKDTVSYFRAIVFFHTAPLVKFCYHTLSYIVFLCLFCYFMLTDLRPVSGGGPSMYEYIVWGWAGTMLIEEFRQIFVQEPNSLRYKMSSYFSSVWNRFDMGVYGVLIACVILRYALPDNNFVWARRFYAVTLTMFFLRIMHTFYVAKNMGPKVIMIRKMLNDLIFFILILLVFVLAYGVAAQALRFPNAPHSWNILRDAVYMPYWHIYGELFLDEMNGDVEGCDGTNPGPECPDKSWLAMVLLALYMIFTNVLLLNLLIAMFSHTFEKVQENSEKVWRFFRYGLIYEYFDKPTLAPPLIILSHLFRIFKYCIRRYRNQKKVNTDFYKILNAEDNNKLTAFERSGMENYLRYKTLLSREHIDVKVTTAGERIEKVIEDLEHIKETVVQQGDTAAAAPQDEAPAIARSTGKPEEIHVLEGQVSGLQDQLDDQREQMHKMLKLLGQLSTKLDRAPVQRPAVSGWESRNPETPARPATSVPHGRDHTDDRYHHDNRPPHHRSHHRRGGDRPHVEIQEYPSGYTDT